MLQVLSVGNCSLDEAALAMALRQQFPVEVVAAGDAHDALLALRRRPFHLVLVNRLLHRDGSEGLELIRQIKADPELAATPVMLVSNYAEYQKRAVSEGAEPGFGKSDLRSNVFCERLAAFLTAPA